MKSLAKSIFRPLIVLRWVAIRPHLVSLILTTLYLLIFQWNFITTGDVWAEAFYEYVSGAIYYGMQGFFQTGIAGYYNFLPKLVSYPYIVWGLPVGYIDYFFRFAAVIFTLLCTSFVAHPVNRGVIRSDTLRIVLSAMLLMTLYHVSSFNLINVWYIGFIPLIFVSLSSERFSSQWIQISYAASAAAVCLSKPSLILIPLVTYRMIRLKEYFLGAVILTSIGLQTALFFTSEYFYNTKASTADTIDKIINVVLYTGVIGLKLFQLYPTHFTFVIICLVAIAFLFIVILKARGIIQTLLIGLTLALTSYSAIYAPDNSGPVNVRAMFVSILHDPIKFQREVIISALLLIVLIIAVDQLVKVKSQISKKIRPYVFFALSISIFGLVLLEYRPIYANDSGQYIDITPFRASLSTNAGICMPIPPTPSWRPHIQNFIGFKPNAWLYESRGLGSCARPNEDTSVAYGDYTATIGAGTTFVIPTFDARPINSILIMVKNPKPDIKQNLTLVDNISGKEYYATVKAKSNGDTLSYASFNLIEEPTRQEYEFTIRQPNVTKSDLRLGLFVDGRTAVWPYFLDPGLKKVNERH